ncbi:unannotated protein [freshwater metagenome]|uniref:Unannotated protein n=1 Tax=freshwater metagenome TaxID=449393 RepID=A0A6J6Y5V6_9ZZZZ|nr:HPr family phosphocarrier protein [Actinomycetota bacterium]MSW62666.1 HPr family phosphocarrier protein [Actinomycetota bacterium]MSX89768.1 HPr family phosphocarrier protein [Actinomycetota bacterium]MSZ63777.1 HPr family phosphocarrier protein [Actinomycetota bacterium]MTA58582.1 HPr family phosphocarrier protein [Actinomycetota bacterium]
MIEFRSTVASAVGLHARPAALFASSAKSSGCTVRLSKVVDGVVSTPVDGASVLRVMTLGVKCGDQVVVQVEGATESETLANLQMIVESVDH